MQNEYQHDPAKLFGTIKTCLELDGRFLMPQESPFPVITLSNKGIRFVILFSTIQVFIAKIEEAIGKFQQRSSLMSHGGSSNKIEGKVSFQNGIQYFNSYRTSH